MDEVENDYDTGGKTHPYSTGEHLGEMQAAGAYRALKIGTEPDSSGRNPDVDMAVDFPGSAPVSEPGALVTSLAENMLQDLVSSSVETSVTNYQSRQASVHVNEDTGLGVTSYGETASQIMFIPEQSSTFEDREITKVSDKRKVFSEEENIFKDSKVNYGDNLTSYVEIVKGESPTSDYGEMHPGKGDQGEGDYGIGKYIASVINTAVSDHFETKSDSIEGDRGSLSEEVMIDVGKEGSDGIPERLEVESRETGRYSRAGSISSQKSSAKSPRSISQRSMEAGESATKQSPSEDRGSRGESVGRAPSREDRGSHGESVGRAPSREDRGSHGESVGRAPSREDWGSLGEFEGRAPSRESRGSHGEYEGRAPSREDRGSYGESAGRAPSRENMGSLDVTDHTAEPYSRETSLESPDDGRNSLLSGSHDPLQITESKNEGINMKTLEPTPEAERSRVDSDTFRISDSESDREVGGERVTHSEDGRLVDLSQDSEPVKVEKVIKHVEASSRNGNLELGVAGSAMTLSSHLSGREAINRAHTGVIYHQSDRKVSGDYDQKHGSSHSAQGSRPSSARSQTERKSSSNSREGSRPSSAKSQTEGKSSSNSLQESRPSSAKSQTDGKSSSHSLQGSRPSSAKSQTERKTSSHSREGSRPSSAIGQIEEENNTYNMQGSRPSSAKSQTERKTSSHSSQGSRPSSAKSQTERKSSSNSPQGSRPSSAKSQTERKSSSNSPQGSRPSSARSQTGGKSSSSSLEGSRPSSAKSQTDGKSSSHSLQGSRPSSAKSQTEKQIIPHSPHESRSPSSLSQVERKSSSHSPHGSRPSSAKSLDNIKYRSRPNSAKSDSRKNSTEDIESQQFSRSDVTKEISEELAWSASITSQRSVPVELERSFNPNSNISDSEHAPYQSNISPYNRGGEESIREYILERSGTEQENEPNRPNSSSSQRSNTSNASKISITNEGHKVDGRRMSRSSIESETQSQRRRSGSSSHSSEDRGESVPRQSRSQSPSQITNTGNDPNSQSLQLSNTDPENLRHKALRDDIVANSGTEISYSGTSYGGDPYAERPQEMLQNDIVANSGTEISFRGTSYAAGETYGERPQEMPMNDMDQKEEFDTNYHFVPTEITWEPGETFPMDEPAIILTAMKTVESTQSSRQEEGSVPYDDNDVATESIISTTAFMTDIKEREADLKGAIERMKDGNGGARPKIRAPDIAVAPPIVERSSSVAVETKHEAVKASTEMEGARCIMETMEAEITKLKDLVRTPPGYRPELKHSDLDGIHQIYINDNEQRGFSMMGEEIIKSTADHTDESHGDKTKENYINNREVTVTTQEEIVATAQENVNKQSEIFDNESGIKGVDYKTSMELNTVEGDIVTNVEHGENVHGDGTMRDTLEPTTRPSLDTLEASSLDPGIMEEGLMEQVIISGGRPARDVKTTEADRRHSDVKELRKQLEEKCLQVSLLEVELSGLKTTLAENEVQLKGWTQKTEKFMEHMKRSKQIETDLQAEISRLESSKTLLSRELEAVKTTGTAHEQHQAEVCQLQQEMRKREEKYKEDAKTYQDQIKKDTMAICAMEGRLDKVMQKNKDYVSDIQALRERLEALHRSSNVRDDAPPVPKLILQKPAVDSASLEQVIEQLRKDNASMSSQLADSLKVQQALRKDLATARATGESHEVHRRKLEKKDSNMKDKEKEINSLRQQMTKLTGMVDDYKEEITKLKSQVSKHQNVAVKFKKQVTSRDEKIVEMEEKLNEERKTRKKEAENTEIALEKGRIASQLTSAGAQCRGERHEETIVRQREALAELRTKIKFLEQTSPSVPTHDQGLQQIILLKRELAELRAAQALSEQKVILQTPPFRTSSNQSQQARTSTNQSQQARTSTNQSQQARTSTNQSQQAWTSTNQSQQAWTSSNPIENKSEAENNGRTECLLPSISKSIENKQRLSSVLKEQSQNNRSSGELTRVPGAGPSEAWTETTTRISRREDQTESKGISRRENHPETNGIVYPLPPDRPRPSDAMHEPNARLTPRRISDRPRSAKGHDDAPSSVVTSPWVDHKTTVAAEDNFERSAHLETYQSLELSEETYLNLLRDLSAALDLQEVPGNRNLAHLAEDERRRLSQERNQAIHILATKVHALKERIIRKDQLLQGYDKDLAKLRQAEALAEERAIQLENLSAELRLRTEESMYLRSSADRTREQFEQQKRLNVAIKHKKTFHLENGVSVVNGTIASQRHAHCNNESTTKEIQKKKESQEKMKKKNYEIRMLKDELAARDRQLGNLRRNIGYFNGDGAHVAKVAEVQKNGTKNTKNVSSGHVTFEDDNNNHNNHLDNHNNGTMEGSSVMLKQIVNEGNISEATIEGAELMKETSEHTIHTSLSSPLAE